MSPAIRDSVVPGSVRVEVRETTWITVRCGRCGAGRRRPTRDPPWADEGGSPPQQDAGGYTDKPPF